MIGRDVALPLSEEVRPIADGGDAVRFALSGKRRLPVSQGRWARYTRRGAIGLIGAAAAAHTLAGAPAASPVRTRFGVNAVRLFLDEISPGGGESRQILAALGEQGIPFARFAASGHWAGEWAGYEADPKRYWSRMDRVFAAAEDSGVALVPSVFWHVVALAFHCREPIRAWADPESRTRTIARRYTEAFVARYDRSPALLMYEFANELNDWVDLPNVLLFWPKRDQTMPERRPIEQDRLSSVQLRDFVGDFARTIRARSSKPIGMGSNTPRPNAWHLVRGSWDTDTPDQFTEQFRAINAPQLDVLSIHTYEDKYGQRGSTFATLPELLAAFTKTAALDGRLTFVGEFGIPTLPDRADERRRFESMVDAIGAARIDYAAVWNYSQKVFQPGLDISPDNDRAYQLDIIRAANRMA